MSPETSDLLFNQQSEEAISDVSQTEKAARPPRSASAYLSSLSDSPSLFYLSRCRSRLGPRSRTPLRPSRCVAMVTKSCLQATPTGSSWSRGDSWKRMNQDPGRR